MLRIICVGLACVMLAGCASGGGTFKNFSQLSETEKKDDISASTKAAIDADWADALSACDSYMAGARDAFYGSGNRELTIASVGIIAGSIVVPALAAKTAAAKSTVAAWGGVSGASNAAQYTMQQKGFSASRVAASYNATREEIKAATIKFAAATKNTDRMRAVYDLHVACRYPALPGADAPKQPDAPPATKPGEKEPEKGSDKGADKGSK